MSGTKRTPVGPIATALAILAASMIPANPAPGATVTLEPIKDNTLYDPECEKSNGSGAFMFSGNTDGQGLRRALVAFDVAGSIPSGSIVTDVSLTLHCSRSNSGSMTHTLHVLTQDWGEGLSDAGDPGGAGDSAYDDDATWCYRFYNKNDPGLSLPWSSLGGDFVGAASASQAVSGTGFYTWNSATMVTEVQGWLDSPASNFGWLVKGEEGQSLTAKRFDTGEHSTASVRPKLVVVYGEAATPPDVAVVSPNGGETVTGNAATSVTWTATDESGIAHVDLWVSLDDGTTWDPVDFEVANTVPYSWFAANRPSAQARLRVVATDNSGVTNQDESDAPFTIVSPPGGLVGTTLRDFDQPGTQPLEVQKLKDPANCGTCHGGYGQPAVEPYRNWQGSMMAQASIDPLFEACLAIANQDAPDSGDLCLRCHDSKGWLAGRSVPTDGSRMLDTDKTGVSCNLCHRMVDPIADAENPPEDGAILAGLELVPSVFTTGQYVIDPDASSRRGPFDDTVASHAVQVSPFHQEAAFCGTCHDVSNPAFTRDPGGDYLPNTLDSPATDFGADVIMAVERTYSEWFHSEYNSPGGVLAPQFGGNLTFVSTCQDCHLRDVTGQACNEPLAPVRTNLPLHDMTGGSTWIPTLLDSLYPGEVDEAALLAGIDRARYMLQHAATLSFSVSGPELSVRVTNETGHKLPTGYPEGRRMWLNVRFLDGGSQLIGESGAYDAATGVLTHDPEAKVYETEPGTKGVPGLADSTLFHFVLNNAVYKDNRIPPRGFTNAAFAAFGGPPVGATYADGQYWDDTVYGIPAGAVTAEVTLYYQSTSKEYVEFLRDENTTNAAGQRMYDLWNQNGKCPPEAMTTLTVDLTAVATIETTGPRPVNALHQNFPNPFAPSTRIRYSVAQAGRASLAIYDVQGRLVSRVLDGEVPAGQHLIEWNGTNDRGQLVATGIYYYVLRTASTELRRKMVLIR